MDFSDREQHDHRLLPHEGTRLGRVESQGRCALEEEAGGADLVRARLFMGILGSHDYEVPVLLQARQGIEKQRQLGDARRLIQRK